VERESPGIFELYEQNIGLLQPLLAEELAEAESTYPASWIVDAFRIAAEHNVRNWRYIKSILERWQRDGKDDEGPLTDRGRRRRRIP
jgi:DnaD/phage-associated family protein